MSISAAPTHRSLIDFFFVVIPYDCTGDYVLCLHNEAFLTWEKKVRTNVTTKVTTVVKRTSELIR